jgi:hypothetical protein
MVHFSSVGMVREYDLVEIDPIGFSKSRTPYLLSWYPRLKSRFPRKQKLLTEIFSSSDQS